MLIELALPLSPRPARVLDLGTGSGILAVTLALEFAQMTTAVDLSFEALLVARANARRLGAPVRFVQSDFGAALRGTFDLIVANPPYVDEEVIAQLEPEVRDHEPRLALSGGEGTYRRCIADAARLLKPGGWFLCEIGYDQAAFRGLFDERWESPALHHDLAGHPRALAARLRS